VFKVETQHAVMFVFTESGVAFDGIALLKIADAHPSDGCRQAIKLSTFKVADHAAGRRLGELLLKAVLRWAAEEP